MAVQAENNLQDKGGHDDVAPLLSLPRDETHVSAFDLNREHAAIALPLRPMLRVGVPAFDGAGKRRGAVIVSIDAGSLLPPRRLGDIVFFVIDDHGVFLRHPDAAKEFGRELGHGATLGRDYPDVERRLRGRVIGTEQLPVGLAGHEAELIAFRQLAYDPADRSHRWLVIAAQPSAIAFAPIDSLTQDLTMITLAVALLACVAGWFSAHHVTRPLQQIIRMARRIAAGDLHAEVEVGGSAELAELGTAFNVMTTRLGRIIEDERQARDSLSALNQELQRSNQELSSFAHAASHDLRTPLRALRALAEWVEMDLADSAMPDEVREHLAEMRIQGERMEDLITRLLQYARLGRVASKVEPFDPEAAVRETLNLLHLPEDFVVEIMFEPSRITAVLVEFELILRNLVQNAVTHHDREQGRIRVTGTYIADYLVLEVADDGPGIPPEYHQRVLQLFCTLRPRDDGGGTGLGLALVDKIVQRWGGRIDILSRPGLRGTTFRLLLPIEPCRADDPDVSKAPSATGRTLAGSPLAAAGGW